VCGASFWSADPVCVRAQRVIGGPALVDPRRPPESVRPLQAIAEIISPRSSEFRRLGVRLRESADQRRRVPVR
jgi:hypothetical protein